MAMKSRRRSVYRPCPCNNVCACHKPASQKFVYGIIITSFLLIFGVFLVLGNALSQTKSYIEVNGKMCEVGFKQTGITSTGAPIGHKIAICPR